MRINEQGRAAIWAKLMRALLLTKEVVLHCVLAALKDDILSCRIDVVVPGLGTYAAVAIHDAHRLERRQFDFISDLCAMAIGIVPPFPWLLGARHDGKMVAK